jgi:hypothetical protein
MDALEDQSEAQDALEGEVVDPEAIESEDTPDVKDK